MCILMGKRLAVFQNIWFFVFRNANLIFSVKKDFECSFRKLKCRWLQTGLTKLKNTKQLKHYLGLIFHAFLKMMHFFKKIKFFENH